METRCLSSLSKVFADSELLDQPFSSGSAMLNETYSFQVAFRAKKQIKSLHIEIDSNLKKWTTVRSVGLVPSEFPCYDDHDDHILRSTPGLYPDPLYPLDGYELNGFPNQWRSIWVTVKLNGQLLPGKHPIRVLIKTKEGELLGEESFNLEVISALLPKQKLMHTEWFHTDCLATHYDIDVFSEEHWKRIDQYVHTAVNHGMNMILTPLFTPPLDTEIGGERPTVQLVSVEKKGQTYHFGFERLERWVALCNQRGVEYFEFSHFFTQWGAKHAPKIIVSEHGKSSKMFGWDTDASGEAYRDFLQQFMPCLIDFVEHHHLKNRCRFHVSDEPRDIHFQSYQSAYDIISPYLKDYPIMDALSDYAFYEQGLVQNPIPANNHIEPFLENEVPHLWTYYCCSQYKGVANRFFNMPSARNRILGYQLYKYHIEGFLHWGYNFWYSQYSKKQIDPFKTTDADCGFPSGDAFLVYPGKEGPIDSIRLEVLYEAIQDLRAFELLESWIGKEKVIQFVESELDKEITFNQYPQDSTWLLSLRERMNQKVKELAQNYIP